MNRSSNMWWVYFLASLAGTVSPGLAAEWSISGHLVPQVHAVHIDDSANQLSMLVSLRFDNAATEQQQLKLITFDLKNDSRASEVNLKPIFELRSTTAIHADSSNNQTAIAHSSSAGNFIRIFDQDGDIVRTTEIDSTGQAIVGLHLLGDRYIVVATHEIVAIDRKGQRPRKLFSVPEGKHISSTTLNSNSKCPIVVLIGDSIDASWTLQSLCESDTTLSTGTSADSEDSIMPGTFTRIIGQSTQRQTFWIAGPSKDTQLRISTCSLGNDAVCIPTSYSSSLPKPPILATHLPVAMVSESEVAVVNEADNSVKLEVYDLKTNKRSDIKLHRSARGDESKKSHTKLSGVYVDEADGSIATLVSIIVMPSSDPEKFIRDGYRYEYQARMIHLD